MLAIVTVSRSQFDVTFIFSKQRVISKVVGRRWFGTCIWFSELLNMAFKRIPPRKATMEYIYIVSPNWSQHVIHRWLRCRRFAPPLRPVLFICSLTATSCSLAARSCSPPAPPCSLVAPPCSLAALSCSPSATSYFLAVRTGCRVLASLNEAVNSARIECWLKDFIYDFINCLT